MNVASVLSNAHIPCLIWGTDAIDLSRRPSKPTGRFHAHLHLLFADANIQSGAEAIVTSLPDIRPFTGGSYDCQDLLFDPLEPPSFPHSICLEVTRLKHDGILQNVFLHPESQFYFDIEDHTRAVPLRSFPEGTRLPTLSAFFDSLIEVHSDPPTGRDFRTLDYLLRDWLLFLVPGVQPLLPNGELKPRCLSIMESLKPENSRLWLRNLRFTLKRLSLLDSVGKKYSTNLGAFPFAGYTYFKLGAQINPTDVLW